VGAGADSQFGSSREFVAGSVTASAAQQFHREFLPAGKLAHRGD